MTGLPLLLSLVWVLTAPVPGLVLGRPALPRRPARFSRAGTRRLPARGVPGVATRLCVPVLERAGARRGLRARAGMGSARALLKLPAAARSWASASAWLAPIRHGLTRRRLDGSLVAVAAFAVGRCQTKKWPRVAARGRDDQDL